MPSEPLTAAIADFVDQHPAIEAAVAECAKKVIADSLSCIVAGAASEVPEPMLAYLQRTGRMGACPLLGTDLACDPEAAALANGTFGHGLDYDDGSVLTPVHPSVTMVSARLGRAELAEVCRMWCHRKFPIPARFNAACHALVCAG